MFLAAQRETIGEESFVYNPIKFMALTWREVERLKRDYHLLDVQTSASAQVIRHAFHRMVKRWHPDLYSSGSREQQEATQIMKQINDAYANIRHAPLRYHIGSYPEVREPPARSSYQGAPSTVSTRYRENLPVTDRMEYWVRCTCGALFGFFVSTWAMILLSRHALIALLICGVITLSCACTSARYGDSFWYRILGSSWRLWW